MIESILEHLKTNWFGNSYVRMVMAMAIAIATIFLRMLFVKLYNRFIAKSSGELKNDPTNYTFLKHTVSALIYIVGFSVAVYTVPSLRTLANSMLAGAGILAVAVGFASQHAMSNIISGVFIIMFKPFRVNDRLQLKENVAGIVEDITLRHTVIRNYENRRVIIPNSLISEEILINSDIVEEKICKIMEVGIGYGADIKLARKIIQEEALKHPSCIDNRKPEEIEQNQHPVLVRVIGWGDFSINLRIWVWAQDSPSAYVMGCELLESIKERFEKEGVEIPFPYRNVIHHNAENRTMEA